MVWQKYGSGYWCVGVLPGLLLIGVVATARLIGAFQFLEWGTLDYALRLRSAEPLEERIVIVGINEGDIQSLQTYPLSDQDLANLLMKLQKYQPRAIGLDIFRDIPIGTGHLELTKVFADLPKVFVIEKILPDQHGFTVAAPLSLPDEQVGFADAVVDADGFLRRSLLGNDNLAGEHRFSFTIQLAAAFLEAEGISLENGFRDYEAMRFGSTELHRFRPNTGGYVRADAGGNQILINFRSGPKPFRIVSLQDIQSGAVEPEWFRDRLVLVGITASSHKDLVNSAAIVGENPGLVTGIEVQAHAVSQIISAVLDKRPLLTAWPEFWEYTWITLWGCVGIILGRFTQSPGRHFGIVASLSVGLVGCSYVALTVGLWTPLAPALIVFSLNSVALYAFYLYDQGLRTRIQERQRVIESTFNTIHNGPLQTLALALRHTHDQDCSWLQLSQHLQDLNRELRDVYESVRQETLTEGSQFHGVGDRSLNLHTPLHEVLYEVYMATLERDFPCFQDLNPKIIDFKPFDSRRLSLEQKRDLCRFLEESLCNVGKYAIGVTRLTVVCGQEDKHNAIRVVDNGVGIGPEGLDRHEGRGTQQAKTLARQLRGKFQRSSGNPQGTVCELIWPIDRPHLWQVWPR